MKKEFLLPAAILILAVTQWAGMREARYFNRYFNLCVTEAQTWNAVYGHPRKNTLAEAVSYCNGRS